MLRTNAALSSSFVTVALALLAGTSAHAGNDTWKFGLNANWENGGSWTDGTTPGNADTATLGFASTYTVTFGAAPAAIQNLTVNNGGNVTFTSTGGTKTLNVTAAAGADSLNLGTGTTLILGTSGNIVNLNVSQDLNTGPSSDLEARFGSHITANDFSSGGLGGSIIVNGAGSLLTISGSGTHFIGGSNGSGSLTLQNSTSSAAISGSLGIGDSSVASGGSVALTGNSTATLAGDLKLASQNIAGSSGTLSVAGATTMFTQSGTGAVIVGSFSNGSASINVAGSTSATLTTGTGGLGIRSNGSVNVGGGPLIGTLNVNGDIYVSGGGTGTGLTVSNLSTLTQAAGKIVNVSSGGLITLNSPYAAPTNQTYYIDGAGSKFQVNNADFGLGNGAVANLTNGGAITAQSISVGTSGNGNLSVDGAGSTVTATTGTSNFGLQHSTGIGTFSHGGTGSFPNGLQLACSIFADTSAIVTVQSGGHLNTGVLNIAVSGGPENPTATLTVTGAGSTVWLNPSNNLQLSDPNVLGNATVNVQDNGSLTVGTGGSTLMYPGAVFNINGGYADLKTLTYGGGTINFTAGSLSFLGNLQVGVGGALGSDVTINAAKQLTLDGTTTIDPFHSLSLTGGTLNTGGLSINGTFNFTGGTLNITGGSGLTIGSGGPFGSAFTLQAGRNLGVSSTTNVNSGAVMALDSGAGFSTGTLSVNSGSEFDLNGGIATANVITMSNFGLIRGDGRFVASGGANALANKSTGEIRAESGKRLQFIGNNAANVGKINMQGGTAEFANALTNGAAGQIVGRGTLKVGGLGLTNQGNIALASGITDVFGDVNNNTGSGSLGISISGNAAVNFWDDVTNTSGLFKVNSGSTATFFGTFSGNGITGNASDIHFESDISPGFSPLSVNIAGNVTLGAGARLNIELGGTSQSPTSQYDQVHVGGNLSLDGTLRVSLINNFNPSAGNSFDILDWANLSGTFTSLILPTLSGGLGWDTSKLYTDGTLSVIPTGVPGDYNSNGVVDAADYVQWRKGGPLANEIDTPGVVNGADYVAWRQHFGATSGSSEALDSASSADILAVPEPAGITLLGSIVWMISPSAGGFRRFSRRRRSRTPVQN